MALPQATRTGDLWGAAPNPARFFEKSVGKTLFYRKVSRSLRSRDTLRLFLYYLKFRFSFSACIYGRKTQTANPNPYNKKPKLLKNIDELARSRQGGVTAYNTRG